jgi:glycosyltransferase involved in cell wall biosynthesis
MRILHVIPTADPASGGPIEGVRMLAHIYKRGGHEMELATLDAPGKAAQISFPAPVHGLGPGLGLYGFSWRALPWFKRNLARFDVVILNTIWQYSTVAAYLALRRTRIPFGIYTHGMLDPYFKRRFPLKHIKKLVYWFVILRHAMQRANTIFFTAEEERLLARQSFPGYGVHETVVPYGTMGPECELAPAVEKFFAQWPQLRGKRLAITLGRIHPKKGVDLLIEAFARTMAHDPDWQLVIVGPDQIGWKKDLEELAQRLGIAHRICWIGLLQGDLKWGALAASEVFVLPSHQENFGIVVAEALSCGLPVILSNRVNIWREVVNDRAGLVNDDTLDGVIASLRRWMELTPQEIAEVGQRSFKCYQEQFNLHRNAGRNLDALVKLMRGDEGRTALKEVSAAR